MLQNFFTNQVERATFFDLEAIQVARAYGLREQLAFILNDMGSFIYPMTGEFRQALDSLLEAREIFEKNNNLVMLTDNLTNAALDHFLFGEFELVKQSIESAYRISVETGNLWGQAFSMWCFGFYYIESLNLSEALSYLVRADKLSEMSELTIGRVMTNLIFSVLYNRIGDGKNGECHANIALQVAEGQSVIWQIYGHSILAYSYVLQGELERARDSLNLVLEITGSPKNILAAQLNLTDYLVAMSEYQLSINQPEPVIEFTSLFLNHPNFLQAIAAVPYYQYYQARALCLLGKQIQAQDLIIQAEATARRLRLNWILWKIYALQTELFSHTGDLARSRQSQQQAKDIITTIVATAGDSSLGNQFISQPAVQAILTNTAWDEHKTGGKKDV